MSKADTGQPLLRHWQREFLDKVLSATPPANFILRVPTGGGKTAVVTALIVSVLENPTATVLVASSRRDTLQTYSSELDRVDKPIRVSDFARLVRDQRESVHSKPAAGAYLATYDLLERPDARQTLTSTTWDLVVLDNHISESMLHGILEPIVNSHAKKLVVIAPHESQLPGLLEYLGNPEVYAFDASSALQPKYRIDALLFRRSEPESKAVELALSLFADSSALKTRLARSADSSLAAFEREIFNLRNNIVHRGEAEALVYEGPGGEELNQARDSRGNASTLSGLMSILNELRMVRDDAKTDALVSYIAKNPQDRTAVITSYPATAKYLQTVLDEVEGANQRNAIVFTPNDNKLFGDAEFSTLVLFDLPWDPHEVAHIMQVTLSQLPIHRDGLKVMVMTDDTKFVDVKNKLASFRDMRLP